MKILYFTKYSRLGASSRMRSYQYFPYFEKQGWKVVAKPLFDDTYLKDLYSGKNNKLVVLFAYIKRFLSLFSVRKYDRVVIEKELFPFLPALVEKSISFLGVQYIVDYDDAIFHNYDLSPNRVIRFFLSKKIDKVMKYSGLVVAGNSYLADRASKAGAKRIEIIPTVVDIDRYYLKKIENNKLFVIGWVGTKSTFEKHLLPQKKWIQKVQKQLNVVFHIVGVKPTDDLGKNVRFFDWSEESEVELITKFDIGIMPLSNSPWEKGKCAYKLIQYGACSIPGIASDVGMNKEVTIDGVTGFLANTDSEWLEKINVLINNIKLRELMGENARKLVEEKYCLQVTNKIWIEILNKK